MTDPSDKPAGRVGLRIGKGGSTYFIGSDSPPIALGTRKGLGLVKSFFAVDLLRPEAAAGNVIPIEILRRRAIREPDFERAALRHA